MTIFLVIFAIGFIIAMIVLASAMADVTENDKKDDTAYRDKPNEEQQLDQKGSARLK